MPSSMLVATKNSWLQRDSKKSSITMVGDAANLYVSKVHYDKCLWVSSQVPLIGFSNQMMCSEFTDKLYQTNGTEREERFQAVRNTPWG